jgi:hypothetical protein
VGFIVGAAVKGDKTDAGDTVVLSVVVTNWKLFPTVANRLPE